MVCFCNIVRVEIDLNETKRIAFIETNLNITFLAFITKSRQHLTAKSKELKVNETTVLSYISYRGRW